MARKVAVIECLELLKFQISECSSHFRFASASMIEIGVSAGDMNALTETSAATAAARTKTKRRSVNQPPTKVHHLHDQVVSRLIRNAEKAVNKVATVTQPPPGIDLGEAFTTSMMITVTNVPRTNANGGRANQPLLELPQARITIPGRDLEKNLDYAISAPKIVDATNNTPATPVVYDGNTGEDTPQKEGL